MYELLGPYLSPRCPGKSSNPINELFTTAPTASAGSMCLLIKLLRPFFFINAYFTLRIFLLRPLIVLWYPEIRKADYMPETTHVRFTYT